MQWHFSGEALGQIYSWLVTNWDSTHKNCWNRLTFLLSYSKNKKGDVVCATHCRMLPVLRTVFTHLFPRRGYSLHAYGHNHTVPALPSLPPVERAVAACAYIFSRQITFSSTVQSRCMGSILFTNYALLLSLSFRLRLSIECSTEQ